MAGRGRGVGRGQQQQPSTGGRGGGRGPQQQPSTGGRGGGRGPQQPQPFPSTGGRGVGRGQQQPQPFPSTGGRGVGRGQQQPQPFPSTGGRGVDRGQQQQPQPFPSTGRGGSTDLGQQQPSFPTGRGVPVAPQQQSANVLSRELEKTLTIGESSGESSKAVNLPKRPGFGTKGMTMRVKANHFLVAVADKDLHHYDVSISPEVLSKKVCRDIMNELVESFGTSHLGRRKFAYDGRKSVYTAGELPFQSKDFVVKLVDKESSRREKEFKVSIKFASKCDLHHLHQFLNRKQHDAPHETIQCLDVVFRQRPSNIYGVVGRSFFSPQLGATGLLGNGLEYWKGFYQSLRPTQMGLSLNIDMSARGFFESISVSDYVQKYLNKDLSRPLSDQERLKLKRNLKGVRIEVNHTKTMRRHKISGFSNEPLQRLTFPVDATGKMISVVDYFRQTYKIVLKYPHLPAIQTGSDSKPSYLPMEICTIVPGQRFSKKLNERQVTELLRATCQRPGDRENSIMKMVGVNDYNNDEIVNGEFGIRVMPELVCIDARVLPPPKLQFHASGRESLVEPKVGQWNMLNKKMVAGASVDVWTCVCFSRNLDYDRFCRELIGMCCEKGMRFNPTPLVTPFAARPDHIEKTLKEIYEKSIQQKKVIQLLIVILPDMAGSYDLIKRVCETRLGIISQCCQPRQASKFSKQYMENVALKINVKVGGKNSILESARLNGHPYLCDMPTIVIGADVTHPSPGEDSSPSIAAVVASMDWPQVTKYRALVSAQGHRDEIIQDLYNVKEDPGKGKIASGMIRDHILAFYKNTRQKPLRIIFYRDGVSEGQFSQVLLHEVDAIRRACVSIEETYLPRITFIVVQKRHHTRLFPDIHGDRYSTDKSGNILPGTVVDTKICHPTEFDFYLCSHAGIQGTSRPAHYHVLYDENKFTADGIQILTNNLCYTYARCTRSVSIVPPAYYAHLAAARARCYISERNFSSDSESAQGGATGGGATRERTAVVPQLPEVLANVTEVMFYC